MGGVRRPLRLCPSSSRTNKQSANTERKRLCGYSYHHPPVSDHNGLQSWPHSKVSLLSLASFSGKKGDRILGKAMQGRHYIVLIGFRFDNVSSFVYPIFYFRAIWLAQIFTETNVAKTILQSQSSAHLNNPLKYDFFSSWSVEGRTGGIILVPIFFSRTLSCLSIPVPSSVSYTNACCSWVRALRFLMDGSVISEHLVSIWNSRASFTVSFKPVL